MPANELVEDVHGYRAWARDLWASGVFTEAEALGLVMAVLDSQPAAADVDDLVGAALGKVIPALPESVGDKPRRCESTRQARP